MDRRFEKTSLIEIIEDSLKTNWKLPAYSDYGTDKVYTYADVAKNVMRLHEMFKELGIEPGDRIAICDKNSSHWAIAMISVLTYGAVAVPILPDFSIEQIHNIYDHSGASLMFSGPKLVDEFPEGIDLTNLQLNDDSLPVSFKKFDGLKPSKIKFFREAPDDLALISYTSGSTGNSKGVMIPYRSIWSNAKFVSEYFHVPHKADLLPLLPLSHMLGFAFEFMYGTCTGCHSHFLTKVPSPNIVLKAFQEVRPIMIVCVPLVLEKIVQTQVFPVLKNQSLQTMLKVPGLNFLLLRKIRNKLIDAFGGKIQQAVVGGAAMSKEVEDFLTEIGFPYSIGYGMTECGPLICFDTHDRFKQGSCGRVIPRMKVKIDSDDPENVAGEILVRGRNVMLGYYKNPEETKETLDDDRWLHTGDLGTLDCDGYLFIRGRKKTMLLGASGQNIYPEEVEDKILTHSPFEETVVVQRGEKLVALVYISDKELKKQGLTKEDISANLDTYRKAINASLPRFSQISAVEVRDEEFEKTPKRSVKRYLYN